MKDRYNNGIKISVYVLLSIISIIFLFPAFSMISMSLFTEQEISEVPRKFISAAFQFRNYADAFQIAGFWTNDWETIKIPYMLIYLKNSLIVMLLFTLGAVLASTMSAYSFSKIRFKGRDVIFFIVLATMMIPSAVTMLPMFVVYKNLGMMDTLLPQWLPVWFGGGAINVFLFKQFMRGIPNELLEAAQVDGAGHIRRLFQIVVPNCFPIIAFIALQSVLGVWNDFFTPLLYVNSKEKWTLALGIANIIQTNDSGLQEKLNLLMAACTMMISLPIVLFAFGQKYFIENVALSGIKG